MKAEYLPTEIESKWQKKWEEAKLFEVDLKKAKDPYYCLVMFPYPSGSRLHVGHWFQYSIPDSFTRFKRMQGKDVFHPIGFDAFGLPAENNAIKKGKHPHDSTKENVDYMIEQYKRMGCTYDWSKILKTSEPEYYKWTQWLFLQMFKNGLAYRKEGNVNYCPDCKTVLANEQVWDGKCERCETEVVQKPLTQWFWKITDYSDQLLKGLEEIDWPEKTKIMQRNWIGRKTGIVFKEKVKDLEFDIEVFDTVPQTFMAQTFTIIAPEHPLVAKLVEGTKYEKEVMEFSNRVAAKKASGNFDIENEMEGIFTGRYIDNPFGTGDLPIWVASFVVADYGTGIVNCSAHDERDFAFAKKYDIPLKTVMVPDDKEEAEKVRNLDYCYYKADEGILDTPEEVKGMKWKDAYDPIVKYIKKNKLGDMGVNYRIRDWLISRQRYWGAPIPIVYDPDGKPHPIPEEHLPWELPTDVEFKPKGKSPIANSKELKERTEKIFGKGWTPEVDTMDTFVCSSFYQFRFLAEGNQKEFIPKDIEKKWMPVDFYIGGPEHACMHLIYARFIAMALKDFGLVTNGEPFKKLLHQGLITNKGAKMSKSKGNVVSPDEFVEKYGSDVFRLYMMFMGPFTDGGDWSDTGIKGVDRFAKRTYSVLSEIVNKKGDQSSALIVGLNRTIKRVTEDIERLHFNTAISALMEFLNLIEKEGGCNTETAQIFVRLLSPLAPHLSEELWEVLGGKGFVIEQDWPKFDEKLIVTDTVTIAVQVNGKLRGNFEADTGVGKDDAIDQAKEVANVAKFLDGKKIKKEIYVEGKLVSFVV
ncbi:leucine--tRNA ligase [Patescibacteria group bacterium]|nr:leucine--tRNA ligase [Patescibacteria group bacterium]MBU1123768.1 leucine--tRNA ligase [Patescibacteria group bacterium]MBU1911460.1 leucine--tRNA ligase [Patescibacteria group bacterium]